MTVFLLWSGHYEETVLVGIYDSKDKAEMVGKSIGGCVYGFKYHTLQGHCADIEEKEVL